MKTLILNGSPRRNGDTATMLEEMKKYLTGGADTVSAYYDGVAPCVDCRACWERVGCVIRDRMGGILANLDAYDNIIIASPLYFSQLSGPLLAAASRLQSLYIARALHGIEPAPKRKNGVLVLSCGGDGSPKPAEATAKTLLRHMNADYIGSVMAFHTNEHPAFDDPEALRSAREMAGRLNELSGAPGERREVPFP